MDVYLWVKALHLVSVVSLFAGLFYIVRLFIYHIEALERPENERAVLVPQFVLMERRLWQGIVNPALMAATVFGLWLMWMIHAWTQPWFQVKIFFLVLLFTYHGFCSRIRRQLARGNCKWSSRSLRIWNEVATLLLFTIVFTAVFKRPLGAGYGLVAVAVVGIAAMAVLFLARRARR